jgi:hypothetical protein
VHSYVINLERGEPARDPCSEEPDIPSVRMALALGALLDDVPDACCRQAAEPVQGGTFIASTGSRCTRIVIIRSRIMQGGLTQMRPALNV